MVTKIRRSTKGTQIGIKHASLFEYIPAPTAVMNGKIRSNELRAGVPFSTVGAEIASRSLALVFVYRFLPTAYFHRLSGSSFILYPISFSETGARQSGVT